MIRLFLKQLLKCRFLTQNGLASLQNHDKMFPILFKTFKLLMYHKMALKARCEVVSGREIAYKGQTRPKYLQLYNTAQFVQYG
jgi:hypothetical protein